MQPHSHITRGWRQYGNERERANARLAFITPCYTCPSRRTMACGTWTNQKGTNLQIRTSWDRTIHHTFHVTRQHVYLFLFNSLYLNVAYLHGYTSQSPFLANVTCQLYWWLLDAGNWSLFIVIAWVGGQVAGQTSPVNTLTSIIFHGSFSDLARTFITLRSRTSSIMEILPH